MAVPPPAPSSKPALRRALRAARLSAGGRGVPVPPAFAAALRPGLIVASYHPIGGEADPTELVEAARTAGCTVLLPHVVDHDTPLRFLRWDGEALSAGPFGLSQPDIIAHEAAPDIILTPLVGFDRQGNRLGQGAGHYDRAFAAHPSAWRVGIALALQEVPALKPDPWDVPLHAIATEKEWIVP